MNPNIKFYRDASKYRGDKTNSRFLSPVGHVTPEYEVLDSVTNEIFSALQNRNWNVPGITVTFSCYGDPRERYRMVHSIEGNDFLLTFCRVIESLSNHYDNCAGCYKIVIPKHELEYHEDLSGHLNYYTGKDWRADRERFKHDTKVNSKLRGKEKWYVRYMLTKWHPNTKETTYTAPGRLPKFFVAYNNMGRDYNPEGHEPRFFLVEEVHKRIARWLTEHVLEKINATPMSDIYIDPFLSQEDQKPATMP